ncbi:MAG: hypothetical protein ACREEL_02270 [Stellaceae bacterium]
MALVILVAVEIAGASRLPSRVVSVLDAVIFFFGALSVVLSVMRRMEKR